MRMRVLICVSLAFAFISDAEAAGEDPVLRDLPQRFCEAWNHHDGHALAQITSDDVDFVNVGAAWFHGRADFEKYHTRLLSGRFAQTMATPLETNVRVIRPDLVIIHWSWSIQGDKNFDGSPRPKRFGLMTMIAEKRDERWFVIAAQNTNALPGPG
jgi:uncharacterized protein (TIGR02246 family)